MGRAAGEPQVVRLFSDDLIEDMLAIGKLQDLYRRVSLFWKKEAPISYFIADLDIRTPVHIYEWVQTALLTGIWLPPCLPKMTFGPLIAQMVFGFWGVALSGEKFSVFDLVLLPVFVMLSVGMVKRIQAHFGTVGLREVAYFLIVVLIVGCWWGVGYFSLEVSRHRIVNLWGLVLWADVWGRFFSPQLELELRKFGKVFCS